MGTETDEGDYSPEEAKRRFEAALRTALTTPHAPLKDKPKGRPHRDTAVRQPAPSSDGAPSASSSPRERRGRP